MPKFGEFITDCWEYLKANELVDELEIGEVPSMGGRPWPEEEASHDTGQEVDTLVHPNCN